MKRIAVAAIVMAVTFITCFTVSADDTEADEASVTPDLTISNLDGLKAFRDSVNNGTDYGGQLVSLTSDIDLSGETDWTPIGNGARSSKTFSGDSFKGTFEGNGHTISGLTISGDVKTTTGSEDTAKGLFGVVSGGEIRNLTLTGININVTNADNVGAVVGVLLDDGVVSGCNVGEQTGDNSSVTATSGVGGIVGRMVISGTIEDCTNYAKVEAKGKANVGGIVGAAYYTAVNSNLVITNCVNTGTVEGVGSVGGIAGLSAAEISYCSNHGPVSATSGDSVGGIVGSQQSCGSIANCYNTADIEGFGQGTGGIVGWIRYYESDANYPTKSTVEVLNSHNSGNVTSSSSTHVGGIVGGVFHSLTMRGCTAMGTIQGANMIGGLIGGMQVTDKNHPKDGCGLVMVECRASCTVSAAEGYTPSNIGEIIGHSVGQKDSENTECTLRNGSLWIIHDVVVEKDLEGVSSGLDGITSSIVLTDGNGKMTAYSSIQSALDAIADDSSTINLYEDIKVDSPITISKKVVVSGRSISTSDSFTATAENNRMLINITSSGDLTLCDITINADNKCRSVYCNGGKLTVEAGTVITGGKIFDTYIGGVYMTGASVFTMTGGEISGNSVPDSYADKEEKYSADLWIGSQAKGTISGGKVGYAFVNSNSYTTPSAGLILDGGKLTAVFVEWDGNDKAEFIYNDGTVGSLVMATNSDADNHTIKEIEAITKGLSYKMEDGADLTTYGTLKWAVENADTGSTLVLLKSVQLSSTITIKKNLILDLNGLTITGDGVPAFYFDAGESELKNGTLTVTSGINSQKAVVCVGDVSTTGAKLTVASDVVVKSDYSYGIALFGPNANLIVDGKVQTKVAPAISGNGSKNNNGDLLYAPTVIKISGTVESAGTVAVYHPQSGTMTVDGTVTGGIEMKNGELTIGDEAIISSVGEFAHAPCSNGTSSSGCAVALVLNNSYGSPEVTISGDASISGPIVILIDNGTSNTATIGGSIVASRNSESGDFFYMTLKDAVDDSPNDAKINVLISVSCVGTGSKTLEFEGESLNHTWSDWTTSTPATCKTAGVQTHTCSVCKKTESSSIAATGHKEVKVSGTGATCTQDGYTSYTKCSVCGIVLSQGTPIPAIGHSWDSGTVTTEATETSTGVKTYTCTSCGQTKTETIPKLTCTHTWDSGTVTQEATCGAAGSKTFSCTKCGQTKTESIPATGSHNWDSGTVVKEPTTTESGITEYHCSVCGQTKTATIEPKKTETEEKDGVKTTTDTTKTVETGEDGSETVTETTTVSKEENGKVIEKVETTTSTTQKDGTTIVAETTVTEKDGSTEKVETTKSTTETEDTVTVAESTVKEKDGQLVEKVETTTSTTQTEDTTIVSETKVTEKAGEETEKVETTTSTTQKEGATLVAETKVTEKGQDKTEATTVSVESDDGSVKTEVAITDGSTSGIKTVISGEVNEDTITHAIKQADMASEAISDKVSDVSKDIAVPSDNVTLSPTSLSALADSGASLTITGDAGSVGIDSNVAGSLMSHDEDVTVSIMEKKTGLTEAQKAKAGENKVIELSARSATQDFHELGGKAVVRIDISAMDYKNPEVFWLKDDGTAEKVDAVIGEGYAAIELDHFSLYYVAEGASSESSNLALYIVAAVIVIAIIAAAGYMVRKRNSA